LSLEKLKCVGTRNGEGRYCIHRFLFHPRYCS
jgi:hypothetical protein